MWPAEYCNQEADAVSTSGRLNFRHNDSRGRGSLGCRYAISLLPQYEDLTRVSPRRLPILGAIPLQEVRIPLLTIIIEQFSSSYKVFCAVQQVEQIVGVSVTYD